eukprot:COSAG01_NODE_13264_length_1610_cov_4.291198_2_plen_217_part_00
MTADSQSLELCFLRRLSWLLPLVHPWRRRRRALRGRPVAPQRGTQEHARVRRRDLALPLPRIPAAPPWRAPPPSRGCRLLPRRPLPVRPLTSLAPMARCGSGGSLLWVAAIVRHWIPNPARPFSPSIYLDKNRRDIGKSQSIWAGSKMKTAGSPPKQSLARRLHSTPLAAAAADDVTRCVPPQVTLLILQCRRRRRRSSVRTSTVATTAVAAVTIG